ncbi:UDP-N-acetylglucosamine 1-carboxyvinyltransferase [Aerococcus kribbianus]|uniref:UDP-N-acetylglucosamine 1-carboxyvinyltransferase n=1 Tax=Aerococcus kribbianus TaxID=2999064 RepID=A0A9X3FNT3_9LACT|nr:MULTISPECIES: UDP-N-acetylglucosamine 1-carboxyvinyltransferase [unclassified Aerococcus]MCZ0716971.1 UDP-N-acetylglucosamine 1-carboxyvinyltransferase [Aerococcus sp. YH-aer221]MCZ0725259.1 UDP-N-acetylglucosamine 1-carboxyvinyltransferase [Aerococcus sp. YH-aer222]
MTDTMVIKGGNRLQGTVTIDGAKNAVLPILAATLLTSQGVCKVTNAPLLSDVYTMNDVLRHFNADVDFAEDKNEITINAAKELSTEAPFGLVSKMRASVVVMGPLLARFGHVKVAMPGGCAIGSRPIDLHIKGFEALGAKVVSTAGYVEATADKLQGANIYLDFPSVGATQNIMMAAVLAEGTTIIENVAREPEIVDLANFLNRMGAKVQGAGTDTIKIKGVQELTATEHYVIPDRIEAGTFMVAAAVTQGDVHIVDALAEHNLPLISKLKEMGVHFTEEKDGIRVQGPKQLQATNVRTLPYPGFPTDMQAQFTIAQILADGTSEMEETVFENRFMHLEEMRRMNAKFAVAADTATIIGPAQLQGANVQGTDLRAAAALIIAGLVADGITKVTRLEYLDRGYHDFEHKLVQLGAKVKRMPVDEQSDDQLAALFN